MNKETLIAKCRKNGDCLEWQGRLCTSGYCQVTHNGKQVLAHRLAWMLTHGEIPQGLTIDHKCCNKRCINVEHLQIVTNAENQRLRSERRTHCNMGHELTPENIYRDPKTPRKHCRMCRTIYNQRVYAKRKITLTGE